MIPGTIIDHFIKKHGITSSNLRYQDKSFDLTSLTAEHNVGNIISLVTSINLLIIDTDPSAISQYQVILESDIENIKVENLQVDIAMAFIFPTPGEGMIFTLRSNELFIPCRGILKSRIIKPSTGTILRASYQLLTLN